MTYSELDFKSDTKIVSTQCLYRHILHPHLHPHQVDEMAGMPLQYPSRLAH